MPISYARCPPSGFSSHLATFFVLLVEMFVCALLAGSVFTVGTVSMDAQLATALCASCFLSHGSPFNQGNSQNQPFPTKPGTTLAQFIVSRQSERLFGSDSVCEVGQALLPVPLTPCRIYGD